MDYTDRQYNEVLSFASDMGRLLMKFGAETSVARNVTERIAEHYGVDTGEFIILSNSMFTSESPRAVKNRNKFLKMDLFRMKSPRLQYVADIYKLSKDICSENIPLEEAEKRLKDIRKASRQPDWMLLLAAAAVAASYCVLLRGSWIDVATAAVVGMLTKGVMVFFSKHNFTPAPSRIYGGFIATILCIIAGHLGLCSDEGAIINSILVLFFPGVALINGFRDVISADYMTGITRLLHAIVVLLCVLIGSTFAVGCDYLIYGGCNLKPLMQPLGIQGWGWRAAASVVAAVGISMLFYVPRRMHLAVGILGLVGSLLRYFVTDKAEMFFHYGRTVDMAFAGILVAVFVICLLARVFALHYKCPTTVLTIGTLIMLMPSPKLFWSMYCMMFDSQELASLCFRDAMMCIVAIVMGIIFALEIPRVYLTKPTKSK